MSVRQVGLVLAGLAIWVVGVLRFAEGGYVVGGALILLGGLLLVLAAGTGWSHFAEGVANWLFFWR
jgi:hypothetical protein